MVTVDWLGFVIASVAVVLAPGPGSMFVAKTAAGGGVRAGRLAMLGIMAGDTCLIVLSLLGVSALFLVYPPLFHIIRFAGAAYLIFLGIRLLLLRPDKPNNGQDSGLPFRCAVLVTLLNPKALLFFMAFFPIFIRSTQGGLAMPYAMMTVVFMAISATYLSFLVYASSTLALAFRRNTAAQSIARRVCGCVFIGFGLKVAMTSR